MEMPNIIELLFSSSGILILKIPLLVLILIYTLFLFIVINRIKALNRTMTIQADGASNTLSMLAVIQFLLAISLFFITVAIV